MLYYTLGDLVDKLSITNIRIWHTEEAIKRATDTKAKPEDIELLMDQIVTLNKLRVKVVESINEYFDKLLAKKEDGK